jgi:hypothetical protein
MAFEIKLHIGVKAGTDKKEKITIRGADNGTIEFCKTVMMKDKDGDKVPTLVPFSFYSSLENAFDKILKLRVCRSDATTLEELLEVFNKETRNLKRMFGTFDPEEGCGCKGDDWCHECADTDSKPKPSRRTK